MSAIWEPARAMKTSKPGFEHFAANSIFLATFIFGLVYCLFRFFFL